MCNMMKSIWILLGAVAMIAGAKASPRSSFTVSTSRGNVVVEDMLAGTKPSGEMPKLLKKEGFDVAPMIIGGKVVKNIKQFPQLVTLIYFDIFGLQQTFCTGVIIDKKVVYSAAHCFSDWTTPFYVCSGTTDIYNDTKKAKCAEILQAWTPTDYNDNKYYLGYDMAILKLSGNITGKYAKRVKVSFQKPKMGLASYSVGYGITKKNGSPDGKLRSIATKVVLNEGKCKTLNKIGLKNDSDLICAKANKGTTCQGDSGGPLLVKTKKKADYICVGTLSFGLKGCPKGSEAVYSSLYDKDHMKLFKSMTKKVKGKYKTGKLPKK